MIITIDTSAPLSDKDQEVLSAFLRKPASIELSFGVPDPKAEETPVQVQQEKQAPRRRAAAKKEPEPVAEEPAEEEVDETPAVLEEDTPAEEPAPAAEEAEVPSLEEVVKEASPLITAGRAPFVKKALKLAGVARVKELPEDQRVAFLANLKKTDDELDALLEG